jgi:N-acyl-D-amino-acid deacylase
LAIDLLIRNGTVVDGSGKKSFVADVAVSDGMIVSVGNGIDSADREIDASGLVVAPGFIDHHTHYDAQICWDRAITPSSWHGVTTVIMGNCGVGLAPCKPDEREVATHDLVNIESIPYEVLKAGVTWDWVTFPEYMDSADKRGAAINLAFMAPLTPFRHWVMGHESMERAANAKEKNEIAGILDEAVAAGAFGFTTSKMPVHIGYNGVPLACRLASDDELRAYCGVLNKSGRGVIQLALTSTVSVLSDDDYGVLEMLLDASQRPVTWLALFERDDRPTACQDSIEKAKALIRRGGLPQISSRPLINEINLKNPFAMANMESWRCVFNRPKDEQRHIYSTAEFRKAFHKELESPRIFNGNWNGVVVRSAKSAELSSCIGQTVSQIAKLRGTDPTDTFLDIAVEDDLEMNFTMEIFNTNDDRLARLLPDERTLIGLGDGGAHLDALCDAGYATYLLGYWVREKRIMSMEQAVYRLTAQVADLYGIKRRGRIAEGMAADFAIFDPKTVGSPRNPTAQVDFPANGLRLVTRPTGMRYTIVSGVVSCENGNDTGAMPGRVLRSGRC